MKKSSEHSHQVALVKKCRSAGILILAIPNAGVRTAKDGWIMNEEGRAKGFPDLFIPMPSEGKHGMMVELKISGGVVSKEQAEWIRILNEQGYYAVVAYGAAEAWRMIGGYLGR